jgi:hypothetical protein
MNTLLIIGAGWVGLMLISLAVMSALGLHARSADATADEQLPPTRMSGAAPTANEVSVGLQRKPVLQACRDCLSVISGAYEDCPACGGVLAPTRELGSPRQAGEIVSGVHSPLRSSPS